MDFEININKPISRVMTVVLFIIMAISSIGPVSSCAKKEEQIPADTSKTMATDFTLKSITGDTLRLSDFNNKVVVLFFLGFGCSYCKTSAPGIEGTLVAPYASRSDYQVIGLDVWNGSVSALESFKNSTGMTIPMLLNASGVGGIYGTTNDRLIVINKMGYIVFKGNQAAIKDIDAARQIVDDLFAK